MAMKLKKKKSKPFTSEIPKVEDAGENYSIMGFTVLQTASIVLAHKEP